MERDCQGLNPMNIHKKIKAVLRYMSLPQFNKTAKVVSMPNAYPEKTILTPNRKIGGNSHEFLVLHHSEGFSKTGDPKSGDLAWCLNPKSGVSYHVIVAQNGDRTILANDTDRAWHAGESFWDGRKFCNTFTLGLAFGGDTNTGDKRDGLKLLSKTELESALEYILPRAKKYGWTEKNIISHKQIAPKRKQDTSDAVLEQVRKAFREALK